MAKVLVHRSDITTEEAAEALQGELGDGYTVTGGSGDRLTVKKSTMAQAHVTLHPQSGATEFRVSGVGIIVQRIANELGIVRQVTAAINRAPGLGGG